MTQNQPKPPAMSPLRLCDRIISIVTLICLVVGFLYVKYDLHQVEVRLREEQKLIDTASQQIESLNDVLNQHSGIMKRFNKTVTNGVLLARVRSLEDNLRSTESAMNQNLQDTQVTIQHRLNDTLLEMDGIVAKAQQKIQEEVTLVQTQINTYKVAVQDQFSMENNFMIWQLAGTMTIIGGLITMWHMTDHLRHFNQPFVQRKILAILMMCPVYAVTSWFSLVFVNLEGYLAVIKDFYEAYVIYQFLSFLIAVIGRGNRATVVALLAKHADHLSPPYRFCGCFSKPREFESNFAKADAVLLQCQVFAMQFVFLKPLLAISMFTCNTLEYYGGGESRNDWRAPQMYISILQNVSVFFAFSGLLKFYHAVQDELAWCRPFPKFLTIKGVVFMTFWQGMAIAILANASNDFESGSKEAAEWAARAQCFLICLEMLLFSIAHFYCFPTCEWEEGYRPIENKSAKFGDKIALNDFFADLKLVLRSSSTVKPDNNLKTDTESEHSDEEPLGLDKSKDDGDGDEIKQAKERLKRLSKLENVISARHLESLENEANSQGLTENLKTIESETEDGECGETTSLLARSDSIASYGGDSKKGA